MSEIQVSETYPSENTVFILGIEIPVIEYKGERVLTFKMIDQVHNRPEGSAGRNFRQHRDRFKMGKHYFEVCRGDFRLELWEAFGFNKFAAKGFLITKRGYTMLVKSFNDDLAWKVQDELTDHYFQEGKAFDSSVSSIDLIIQSALELKRLEQKQVKSDLELKKIAQKQVETDIELKKINQSQKGLDIKQVELEQRMSFLESEVDHDSGKTEYWTIRSYCNTYGLQISRKESAARGRQASRLSRKMGIPINKSPDELFGKVNTYHKDILKEVFKDLLYSESKQDSLF